MERGRMQAVPAGAALGWLGVGGYGIWEISGEQSGDGWQRPYVLFSISLLVAATLTVYAAWAGTRGSERATLRRVATGLGALAIASSVVAWALPLWMTLIAGSLGLFAVAAPVDVRRGLAAVAGSQLVGMATMFAASTVELGRPDSYGDHPAAFGLGTLVAAAGSLLGLVILARALGVVHLDPMKRQRGERPAPA